MEETKKPKGDTQSAVFLKAPKWSQERAIAKDEFFDLAEDFIDKYELELGRDRALKRFLSAFNKGQIGDDIKPRLRNKAISKATYHRWFQGKKEKGLCGLLEHYNNGGCRISEEIRQEIERLIWENHLCRYQDVHDDLGVKFGAKNVPGYSSVRDYAKRYREEHWPELVFKHEGKKGLRDRNMLPAMGRKDANITRPNQRWEIDTTVGDLFTKIPGCPVVFITKDGKRWKLIGVTDVFSRNMRFFFVEEESAYAVGQVLRYMILFWGLPEDVVIDNGRPFKSKRVLRFLRALGVSVHICLPGNPPEKPFIERGFGTLTRGLFRRLCGYSGNNIQNRPGEIEIKYTRSEAQQLVNDWVESVYGETIHSSTGQRPRERMSPPDFTPKTVDPRELDILLMEEHSRVVRQGVIRYLNGKFFHKLLPEGQRVTFRASDFDAGEIIVFFKNEFLCVAEDYVLKGRNPGEILEAQKEKMRELRTRVKANAALLNKHQPKDYRLHALIEKAKQNKPAVISRKAEVVSFPKVQNIPCSTSATDVTNQDKAVEELPAIPQKRLITSRQEMYLDIRRRQQSGEPLDESDLNFLEEFLDSTEYRLVGSRLEEEAKETVAS